MDRSQLVEALGLVAVVGGEALAGGDGRLGVAGRGQQARFEQQRAPVGVLLVLGGDRTHQLQRARRLPRVRGEAREPPAPVEHLGLAGGGLLERLASRACATVVHQRRAELAAHVRGVDATQRLDLAAPPTGLHGAFADGAPQGGDDRDGHEEPEERNRAEEPEPGYRDQHAVEDPRQGEEQEELHGGHTTRVTPPGHSPNTAALERRRERRGLPPGLAVAIEFGRALLGLVLAPLHLVRHALVAGRRRAEVEALLTDAQGRAEPLVELDGVTRADPLHLFVSCAEASGEIHGRRFVERTREQLAALGAPAARFTGLGSDRSREVGVEIVGDPVARSAMGFGVVLSIGFYVKLLTAAARHLRDERPDVAVFVDSPALHVPLGRLARHYGVPVVHFVTPQYWGWAPWRVKGYRRAVDLGLSILPFERGWFERRGVPTVHVGHPLLDRLAAVEARERPVDDGPIALLPGSRTGVIGRNLPWMLETIAGAEPDSRLASARFVVALGRADLEPVVRAHIEASAIADRVELRVGDLHEVLGRCCAALTVSGTVVLDVAHHLLPMVVLYRLGNALELSLVGRLLTVPHFASVNLLASREVVPEFGFAGDGPRAEVRERLEALVRPGPEREACVAGLREAVRAAGDSLAVERAAGWALAVGAGWRPGGPNGIPAESMNGAPGPQ